MNSNGCADYVCDLGFLIKEKALEARVAKDSSQGTDRHQFDLGYLMAFYEVVSLMQQQAQAFGMSLQEIGLADVDPDKELL